jgi:hypothetical protein
MTAAPAPAPVIPEIPAVVNPWGDWGNIWGGMWGGGGTGGMGAYTPPPAPAVTVWTKLGTVINSEWALLLMVGTPFGFTAAGEAAIPMWFLTALIVVGYLYTFAISKRFDIMAFLAPALGILCAIFFGLSSMTILDSSTKAGFLNTGMVKAISEMSFGVSMFTLYNYLIKKGISRFWRVILSLLELYSVYRFCALTFYQPSGNNNYLRLVYIMILVLCSFLNVTWLTRLLNRGIFRALGNISLAMYISHYYLKGFYFRVFNRSASSYIQGKMPAKDAILFTLFVIAVSVLITLWIAMIRRIIKTVRESRAAKRLAADGAAV